MAFHGTEWWAKGEGKQMELGKVLTPLTDFREKMVFIRGLYNERGAQGEHPQFTDGQSAFRGAARLGWPDSLRHQLRPDRRPTVRAIDEGAEPRPRLRKVDSGDP